ncbi:substrate-binding periplasmic protein [Litoribrevibacter euphylliae]|uniref:Substrate-binding periplasmic protein n=1 Tax=Litoribrevibacter euphylliae TaxID=1834034 RepID=A0ABV7HI26_9GAMM
MQRISLFLIFIISPALVITDEVPTRLEIVCEEWQNYTNKDGSGLYWDILRAVYKGQDFELSLKTVPWKRATALVLQNKRDAIVGEYYLEKSHYLYPELHFAVEDPVVALFKPVLKDGDSLFIDDKQVGWIRGYDFAKRLNTSVNYIELNNILQGIKLLKAERIDLLLDYEQSLKLTATREEIDISNYEFTPVLPGKKLYLAFAKNHRSIKFIRIYEQQMLELYKSGRLAELYEKWGLTQKYQWFEASLKSSEIEYQIH